MQSESCAEALVSNKIKIEAQKECEYFHMKKSVVLIFCICIFAISFSSCMRYNDVQDTFFSEAYLADNQLEALPSPKLDGAVLRNGETLYLNLSRKEYIEYVGTVVDYLLARDDVNDLSRQVSQTFLMFIPMDIICVPIDVEFVPDDENITIFFSLSEGLDPEKGTMNEPVEIKFTRESTKIAGSEYNCRMEISSSTVYGVKVDPCYLDHTYGDAYEELIVPSSKGAGTIKRYSCIYCGQTELSDFIGDMKLYSATVLEGRKYLYKDISSEVVSGVVYEIYTKKYDGADLSVTVNGVEIPRTESAEAPFWRYVFVMPCEDIEISVNFVEKIDEPSTGD